MIIFRCDDVSVNTNVQKLFSMTDMLFDNFYGCQVIWGISPLVHDMKAYDGLQKERIFPQILNAYSDHTRFYKVNRAGIPHIDPRVRTAGHGIIHVDHRLLTREVQEMSIVVSTSLVKASIFIPPFNKWNADTEYVCNKHQIELIKFEDGWRHLMYNEILISESPITERYYFHTHDMELEQFAKKVSNAKSY